MLDLFENSIYDDSTKQAFLNSDKRIIQAFVFCFLAPIALLDGAKDNTKVKQYFRKDRKLRLSTITDDNLDSSLIIKVMAEKGYFKKSETPREITKFLVKLRMGQIDMVDHDIIRNWIADIKPQYLKILPAYMKKEIKHLMDGGTLARLAGKTKIAVKISRYKEGEYAELSKIVAVDRSKYNILRGTAVPMEDEPKDSDTVVSNDTASDPVPDPVADNVTAVSDDIMNQAAAQNTPSYNMATVNFLHKLGYTDFDQLEKDAIFNEGLAIKVVDQFITTVGESDDLGFLDLNLRKIYMIMRRVERKYIDASIARNVGVGSHPYNFVELCSFRTDFKDLLELPLLSQNVRYELVKEKFKPYMDILAGSDDNKTKHETLKSMINDFREDFTNCQSLIKGIVFGPYFAKKSQKDIDLVYQGWTRPEYILTHIIAHHTEADLYRLDPTILGLDIKKETGSDIYTMEGGDWDKLPKEIQSFLEIMGVVTEAEKIKGAIDSVEDLSPKAIAVANLMFNENSIHYNPDPTLAQQYTDAATGYTTQDLKDAFEFIKSKDLFPLEENSNNFSRRTDYLLTIVRASTRHGKAEETAIFEDVIIEHWRKNYPALLNNTPLGSFYNMFGDFSILGGSEGNYGSTDKGAMFRASKRFNEKINEIAFYRLFEKDSWNAWIDGAVGYESLVPYHSINLITLLYKLWPENAHILRERLEEVLQMLLADPKKYIVRASDHYRAPPFSKSYQENIKHPLITGMNDKQLSLYNEVVFKLQANAAAVNFGFVPIRQLNEEQRTAVIERYKKTPSIIYRLNDLDRIEVTNEILERYPEERAELAAKLTWKQRVIHPRKMKMIRDLIGSKHGYGIVKDALEKANMDYGYIDGVQDHSAIIQAAIESGQFTDQEMDKYVQKTIENMADGASYRSGNFMRSEFIQRFRVEPDSKNPKQAVKAFLAFVKNFDEASNKRRREYQHSLGHLQDQFLKAVDIDRDAVDAAFQGLSLSMRRRIASAFFQKAEFVREVKEVITDTKFPIRPLEKLTEKRVVSLMKYNKISNVDSNLPAKHIKSLDTINAYINSGKLKSTDEMVGELHVTEQDPGDVDKMRRMGAYLQKKHRINRHTRNGFMLKRAFSVNLPVQAQGQAEWLTKIADENKGNKSLYPVFHGLGATAASMVLRKGFAFIGKGDPSVTGRMLGDGIYSSPNIDKAQMYANDRGYSKDLQEHNGYLLRMNAELGDYMKDYEVKGNRRGDGIRSVEYIAKTSINGQYKIDEAYEIQIVDSHKLDALLSDYTDEELEAEFGSLNESEKETLKGFAKYLQEAEEKSYKPRNIVAFVNGALLDKKSGTVDFEEYTATGNVIQGESEYGPTQEWENEDGDEKFYVYLSPIEMQQENPELYQELLDNLKGKQ